MEELLKLLKKYNWQTKEMAILTDTAYKYQQCPVFVAD